MPKAKRYNPNPTLHKAKYKLKGLMLFIVPFPILLAAIIDLFRNDFFGTIINAAAFAGFMIAASVAKIGFRNEGKYYQRSIALAPKTPYKTIAAFLLALTTSLTAWWSVHYSLWISLLIGIMTFIGFAFYYGLDPRKDKAGNITLGVSAEELINALEEAEVRISAIETARRKITDIDVESQIQRIVNKAREIMVMIEEEPKYLNRSRKFLKVYLNGAKKVTEGYAANTQNIAEESELENDFRDVLDSIETTFIRQKAELTKNDHFDLDVQIEVLNTQLKYENLK
jgi:5-bromo-4-chloroindolyl phosphate hydrolysis protein